MRTVTVPDEVARALEYGDIRFSGHGEVITIRIRRPDDRAPRWYLLHRTLAWCEELTSQLATQTRDSYTDG